MRRFLTTLTVLVVALGAACGQSSANRDNNDEKVHVVAAFYPLAEIARQVGGARVRVSDLTPVGVEPNDVELTADDVDAIEDATVVLHAGAGFQPAVAKAAARRSDGAVDVGRGLVVDGDPHFWLDPTLMVKAVERVLAALEQADPAHAAEYRANAEQYGRDLRGLDERYQAALANCERREVITAHEAFGYLARRYKLTERAISGLSPEAEASPARLAELAAYVRDHGVTTVFYEELVPRAFAETLAADTGVTTAVLSPLEGLTKDEQAAGDDYLSIMGRNREALVEALGCT